MNQLLPFLIANRGVRGFAVELDEGLERMFGWRQYPPDVARLLGEALAATPLLGADLAQDARFNLQFQGKGALQLLVTQIDPQLNLRGMAKCEPAAAGTFHQLMHGGLLACLLEPRDGKNRYQAVVDVLGEALAESLQVYFNQSEQLPTLIRLAAGSEKLAGFFLQRLPEGAGQDPDHWVHAYTLGSTLSEAEMLALPAADWLRRLFAEDEVRLLEARPVTLACQCSHAQISAMLLGLGQTEIEPVLSEHGQVEVTCEFCGRQYRYSPSDVHHLFSASQQNGDGHTRQ